MGLAAAAAFAAAQPAAAQSTWSAPQRVAVEGASQFSSLRLAVAADGRALLVWATRRPEYAIRAVDIAADGTIGRPVRVTPPGERASGPQVGLARGGEAVVAWRSGRARDRSVKAAFRGAGASSFGAPVRLSPAGGRSLLTGLDMAPDGHATAAWLRRSGRRWRVQVAERRPGGAFGAPRTLSPLGAGPASVAVAANGSRVVVWDRATLAPGRSVVEAATADAGGAFSARRRLSGAVTAFAPRVGVDANGGAIVAWPARQGSAHLLQAVVRRSSAEPFGTLATIASATGRDAGFSEAEAAIDAGRALATWSDFGEDPTVVRVARTDPSGAWSAGEQVSDDRSAAYTPEVRAAGGRAVVVWDDIPQDSPSRSGHLAASVSDGGPWSAPRTVSDPALILQSATSPRLAVAPDGTALAAYVDYGFEPDSGRGQLSVVRLPPG
ncbi:MAG TPA: hypothetical protein VHF89_06755 [Solirubrobacteraceae bacterium]|nr:hypothetical protein [Solirubrobacteraceae bacterium]